MLEGLRTRWALAVGTALILAALTVSLPAGAEPPLVISAEEPGDKIAVTLTSGKTFEGTLVSRDDRYLKIKMGRYEIDLPSRLIDSVKVTEAVRKATEAATDPSGGGEVVEDGEPSPSVVTLSDGRKLKGWVVKRDSENVWVVFGSVHPLLASQVTSVDGGTPLSGGSSGSGGDEGPAEDNETGTGSLVDRLASQDKVVMAAAVAALEAKGNDGVDEMMSGLTHGNARVRQLCVGLLSNVRTEKYHAKFIELLENDPDPVVRATVAQGFASWNTAEVHAALLKSVRRDKDNNVRIAGLKSLRRNVTVRDAPELMTIMGFLTDQSPVVKPLCEALQRATAKSLAPQKALWTTWWEEEGGRNEILNMLEDTDANR